VDPDAGGEMYPPPLVRDGADPARLDRRPLIRAVWDDVRRGTPPGDVAGRFHQAMADPAAAGKIDD
jgi:hydrogenase maturation protein HypF